MGPSDLSIEAILAATRDGGELSTEQIEALVSGIVDETVSRPQAAAWLAWVYVRGMSDANTVALTRAMTQSGAVLQWPGDGGELVDKHSTGGVGDKVSLVLAPLWAELGLRVPMISGRGLGHTGGTLDKLEAIEGYRCDLENDELKAALSTAGCFISGQTSALAPVDRVLYALRDEVGAIASVPLITASILSKKLAEGLDRLVLDVKYGSGAFMKTRADAEQLARTLERVSLGLGTPATAHLTPMEEPLGEAVGNALEVAESIRCLRGDGPPDLHDLVVRLADHPEADACLRSGQALDRFRRMVRAQGGDPDAPLRGVSDTRAEAFRTSRSGTISRVDAYRVGMAAYRLGAGRAQAGEPIHHGVGITVHAKVGQSVRAGERVFTLHHANTGVAAAQALLEDALGIDD